MRSPYGRVCFHGRWVWSPEIGECRRKRFLFCGTISNGNHEWNQKESSVRTTEPPATAGARPGQWEQDVSGSGHGGTASDPAVSLLVVCFTGVNKDLHDDRTSVDSKYVEHRVRTRVESMGSACNREREIWRPAPSPPARGRPPRQRITPGHGRKTTLWRAAARPLAAATAALLFRNSRIGNGFHRLEGDQRRLKSDLIPWLSTRAHPCRRDAAASEKPLFRKLWQRCGIRSAARLDPVVPLSGSDRSQVASSCKKGNPETSLKKPQARHPWIGPPRRPDGFSLPRPFAVVGSGLWTRGKASSSTRGSLAFPRVVTALPGMVSSGLPVVVPSRQPVDDCPPLCRNHPLPPDRLEDPLGRSAPRCTSRCPRVF